MITNDSGPLHIAAALSVPSVSIFGPTDPDRTVIAGNSSPTFAGGGVFIGPYLTVTITRTVTKGPRSAALMLVGHALLEGLLLVGFAFGPEVAWALRVERSGEVRHLVQPFSGGLLDLRFETADGLLTCGTLALDPARRIVAVGGEAVELTKREFDLLQFLLQNKGLVLSRDTLLDRVWDMDFDGGTNAVDVYIRFLRRKLDEPFDQKLIHTVRGVGYVLRSES